MAAERRSLSTIKLLVQSGAKVNQMPKIKKGDGWSALHAAAISEYGNTASYAGQAVYKNQTEIVKFLIQSGADVNLKASGHDGWTPLMCTAQSGAGEICEVLINAGAKVNERSSNGDTALACVRYSEYNTDAVKKVLRAHGGI